jgi:peptidoglycan DL-endopeptidase CwlO
VAALPTAQAAPSLAEVQARVRALQEDAASAGEAAQQAQVQLDQLKRQLASVQQAANNEAQNVSVFQKSLGAIAREEYKSGGLGEGFQLLFSSDPTLYLSSAGALESITRKKSLALKKYSVARQRLTATSLTVNDKLALVKAAEARYNAQAAAARAKLKEAQDLLNSLTAAERARLAALVNAQENADQATSLAEARRANLGSGRGAIALRFAIKQIGDRYVFGAAGPIWWDCSGLTMRAFQSAGVSLPHSAAAQSGYGKRIPFGALRPGDLVFFAHRGSHYISHVGIYLGGGRMVNAPHPGARVKVESFGSTFGSLIFSGARRI